MNLAVFDIDGTLCRTSRVDDLCLQEAVAATWGVHDMPTDWGAYTHSTDRAITSDLFRMKFSRDPSPDDLELVRAEFMSRLAHWADADPALFHATPGAGLMLSRIIDHGWMPAIATGGWKSSAMMKLGRCGLDADSIPAAFADDAMPRSRIVEIACGRALEIHQVEAFDQIVYVGDGLWDMKAAEECRIGFLAIATGERADLFRDTGRCDVLPDFQDMDAFVSGIENACSMIPDRTRSRMK